MLETKSYYPNRQFWNIVKGIGIICVVLGHVASWSVRYIYLFHLPLFYFVSGYLFDEKKYGKNPIKNIKAKFKSTYCPYLIIYTILVLFHNVFYNLGVLESWAYTYSPKEFFINIAKVLVGSANELMGATLWFLPTIFCGIVLLGIIVYISCKIEHKTNAVVKIITQCVMIVILTMTGYMLLKNGVVLPAKLEIVLTVLPFFWMGYFLRNYVGNIEKYLNLILAIIFALILVPVSKIYWMDLVFGGVYPTMYVFAFCGIYVCLYVAKIINKRRFINMTLSYIGKNSMIIMIFHFPILRIVDKIILLRIGDPTGQLYDRLPVCFNDLWYIYFIISLSGSLLIAWLWGLIKNRMRKQKENYRG